MSCCVVVFGGLVVVVEKDEARAKQRAQDTSTVDRGNAHNLIVGERSRPGVINLRDNSKTRRRCRHILFVMCEEIRVFVYLFSFFVVVVCVAGLSVVAPLEP